MDVITANLPILAELLILVVAIVFALLQIRSVNRLQRARADKEERERRAAAHPSTARKDSVGGPPSP
jgi:hypothetical protein